MGNINWLNDYGIPAGVGVAELGLKAWDRKRLAANPRAMEFEPILPYALAVGGTVMRLTNTMAKHDEKIKMAVAASLPRVITGAYDWATTAIASRSTGRTVTARRISATRATATDLVANVPRQSDSSGYLSI